MAMTTKSSVMIFSGDAQVAGTPAIAAPRALYAVAFGSKPKKNPPELLPPSAADRACGIRLKKIEDGQTGIINRSDGSTYLDEKSVLTSGATPFITFAAQWLAHTLPCRSFTDTLTDTCARLGANVDHRNGDTCDAAILNGQLFQSHTLQFMSGIE
jgi:hypothetical protein